LIGLPSPFFFAGGTARHLIGTPGSGQRAVDAL
jgi:hypothetical protein